MKLADVIDLEAQLALDAQADPAVLHARDRSLYRALLPEVSPLDGASQSPAALLGAWLSALRERYGAPNLGERVLFGHRLLRYALLVVGLLGGYGSGEALLAFEQGGAPINVGYFIGVVVLAQLGALLLLLLGLLLRRVLPALSLVGDLTRVLRYLARRLEPLLHGARTGLVAEAQAAELAAAYQRARARRTLYGGAERSLLLWHAQWFATLFNVGVLLSLLRSLLFSDLVFGWSTTVSGLSAHNVQQLCAWLAWPFQWLVPQAVPSVELVEHTQYFRLDGRFAFARSGSRGDPALVGQWWRFLVACTLCYGLLPRFLLAQVFHFQMRQRLRALPLDTPDVQRILRRLQTPAFSAVSVEAVRQGAEAAPALAPALPALAEETALVLYRDIPTEPALIVAALQQDLGLQVLGVHHAGGFSTEADKGLCELLGAAGAAVTLVAEAWEAPDRSLRDFLQRLRVALGPQRTLRVALIGEASSSGYQRAAKQDVQVFRDRLQLLADPYLSVDVLSPQTVAEPRGGRMGRAHRDSDETEAEGEA